MTADTPVLAFLNLGATELMLVLMAFILLFGADKVPDVARSLGRVQARWSRAKRDLQREMRTEEERERASLYEFERQREMQIRSTTPEHQEEQRMREAARALGIEGADTASVPELRRLVAARVGSP